MTKLDCSVICTTQVVRNVLRCAACRSVRALKVLAIAFTVLHFGVGFGQSVPAPWRRDDAVLISLCFDGLGKDAPTRLVASEVTDVGVSTATFELIGHTTTDRPTYQAALTHPMRFRAVVISLPGGSVARFDRPENLERSIEGWVYANPTLQCFANDRLALGSLFDRASGAASTCPDLGLNVSFRVDNAPGYSARRVLERQRGLSILNGLRGCRDLIYGR